MRILKTRLQASSLYLQLIGLSSLSNLVSKTALSLLLQSLPIRILLSSYYILYFRDSKLTGILDIGYKATRSNARFGLSDLEDDMSNGLIVVKKEKVASSLPPKRAHINLTVKALGSQKTKNNKAMNLSLENLGSKETLRKLASFSQAVSISRTLICVFLVSCLLISLLFQVLTIFLGSLLT